MPNEFIVKNGLISQNNIIVSGSIIATGGVTISGSIASASYATNADTLDGLDSTVFTLTSSFVAQTASFTAFTSSINSFSASILSFSASILSYTSSLNNKTASFATTGSNTFIGTETISGSLAISGSGTPFTLNTDTLEITGSLLVTGSTTLTGSLLQLGNFTTTGTIIAQTINVQQVTSSIVYSCGSNIFGTNISNTQQLTGSVGITGSLTIAGASSATSYNGATIFGSTIACSPIGCFATSCATAFIGGTISGTTIYGSTAVCSPVGLFSGCVGIANATPQNLLHIKSAASGLASYDSRYKVILESNGEAYYIVTTPDNSYAGFRILGTASAAKSAFEYYMAEGLTHIYSNCIMRFHTGGSERMRITSDGITCFSGTVCAPTLNISGNSTLNVIKHTQGNYKVYRNLARYDNYGNGVGAIALYTSIPWSAANMLTIQVKGYNYNGGIPFDITFATYAGEGNFYSPGYFTNSGNSIFPQHAWYKDASDKVVLVLGSTAGSYGVQIWAAEYKQGFQTLNDTYAEGWSYNKITTTTGLSNGVAIPDKTYTGGAFNGNYINSTSNNGNGCRYNFTALNTAQDLVGICANNGILVMRDHTAGGTGAFLIDPNQGVICMASNIPATVGIGWNGSTWRWCLTSGSVPRCLGYGFYGA
jgi:hypothetical protein